MLILMKASAEHGMKRHARVRQALPHTTCSPTQRQAPACGDFDAAARLGYPTGIGGTGGNSPFMKTYEMVVVPEVGGEAVRITRRIHPCEQPAIDIDLHAAIDRWQP